MEWLHFSDFHIGKPKGPQKLALLSLINAVQHAIDQNGSERIDAVFITGDIAFSGKAEEYITFRNEFLIPLRNIKALSDAKIFAVPGNHDVDCNASIPIAWETIGSRNQEIFFCEDEEGRTFRSSRATVFRDYWDFVRNNAIISPNPLREVSSVITDESYPVDIVATNTAFFSDLEKESSGETTPSPIDSLRYTFENRTVHKPVLILAHHPLSCIIRQQQKQLSTFLKDKRAVLLHGHDHVCRATFGSNCIRTLGFGASYIANQKDLSIQPYVNTFTHCRLTSELYIRSYSWQSDLGKWIDTTKQQFSDCAESNDITAGEVRVFFPYISGTPSDAMAPVLMRTVQRAAPRPKRVVPIQRPSDAIFNRLFLVSGNMCSIYQKGVPTINKTDHDDGKVRLELELENGKRHLLIIIWALNHVLSSKEVETLNTDLDTEGFSSATIISIGKISNDAQKMYLRLRERKPIEVLVNEGLTSETDHLLTEQQRLALSKLDAAQHSICLLLGENDIYLLTIDESKEPRQFYVVQENGNWLAPTDPLVSKLRKIDPEFAHLTYQGDIPKEVQPTEIEFKEDVYLNKCYKEYNVMKYAALANVGIRFSELPLEELYVNATASEASDETMMRFEQLIGDHLAAYKFSGDLRERIQKQILESVRKGGRQETSRALEFCQKYSAVLITGDPGSGKTCFVKSEILAYCKRALSQNIAKEKESIDWHSNHIPVMVSLSEIVAEKDLDDNGIFVVSSRLLERRGLYLPAENMRSLSLQGRIAFFFDGLDEVVSIEKRAQVVKHINDLVVDHLPRGNRVVVTSRPAAVQVVNLLPALHKLELQGLTEAEIQTLATRLLALRLTATQNNVVLDESKLGDTDNIVIAQLLSDCERNPGVSRMAQNPLLLTLLIMIYANSGAPSAKRHRIYEEAMKTLTSVRGRETGHQPISAQDLRERLGAIALSVYKKESGLLPVRSEVIDVVRAVMTRQRGEDVSAADANAFIQRVAESTGLIALEARNGENDADAIVTFMHHSFLEYFAAIGLSRELDSTKIEELVREPRWREILTLLAGIIGENKDVSPIIKRFLDSGSMEHDVDAKLLIFAIDCALECEVPSEAAQRLLSSSIKNCLTNGAGRLDSWVRAEIGQRLDYLLRVCGGIEFNGMLSELIQSGDESFSAAAIDVAGYAYSNGDQSDEIMTAFENACSRIEDAILVSICSAASRCRVLRTDAALQVISKCLHKSQRIQQAAFEALATVPSLASQHWDDIINGIDSSNSRTSRLASIAAMHAGLNVDVISLNAARKDVLIRALNNVAIVSGPDEYPHLTMKKETLSRLLESPNIRDRILGIRLLPLAEGEEKYVYDMLISLLQNDTPREEIVAALVALRWSGNVIAFIKIDDLKSVIQWLKNGTSDVRIAAAQLLRCFGRDRIAVDALLSEDFDKLDLQDYCERINSLSRAKVETDRVTELIFKELASCLDEKRKMNQDNLKRIRALLDSALFLGENAPPALVNKIREIVGDFKIDESIKRKALLCYPAIAMPSKKSVESIKEFFSNPPANMDAELVQVPSILAKKCRSSVDYVTASVVALSELRTTLLTLHAKYSKRQVTEENENNVTELRNGITEITEIIVAFKDLIGGTISIKKA